MQDVVLSKEALARRVEELEDTLSAVQEDHTSLSATLEHTQQQLQRQSFVWVPSQHFLKKIIYKKFLTLKSWVWQQPEEQHFPMGNKQKKC